MLILPESLKLTRNKRAESALLEKARGWVTRDERSPGIHATDLLDPRLAYWQRKDPRELSDRLVTIFLVGKVLHAFVISSVTGVDTEDSSEDTGKFSPELGIAYEPDLFLKGIVREIKTSRSFYEPRDAKDIDNYLEQLLVYLAATDTTRGELWVLYLNLRDENRKTSPAFRCYSVTISDEDLVKFKTEATQTRERLEVALGSTDDEPWRALPLCREFKCGAGNCDWWDQCRPEGRWSAPEAPSHPGLTETTDSVPGVLVDVPAKPVYRTKRNKTTTSAGIDGFGS